MKSGIIDMVVYSKRHEFKYAFKTARVLQPGLCKALWGPARTLSTPENIANAYRKFALTLLDFACRLGGRLPAGKLVRMNHTTHPLPSREQRLDLLFKPLRSACLARFQEDARSRDLN